MYVLADSENEDDDADELAECDLGPYRYFDQFRATVARELDAGSYPVLLEHSNSDGEWTLAEIPALERELREIATEFRAMPPEGNDDGLGGAPDSLYDCFHNVTGENLFESLLELCEVARRHRRPITFM